MSERVIAPCLLCGKDTITEQRPCVCYDCQENDISTRDMRMGKEWRENSSLEKWFPFTAEKLKQLEDDLNAPRCEACNSELSDCGEQGVDGTPSTECKTCQLRDKISTLRNALVGLVGADGKELDGMEALIRISPVSDDDRAATINAIHALRET